MLFMRGNAMSGAPIISGTNQLPKPPIKAGMIMKNTMIRPCAVTNTLKVCGLVKYCMPGLLQLEPHADRQQPADHARKDRRHQIERADVLVVGRIEPAPPAGRAVVVFSVMRRAISH